jgi:hypothetical protein
MNIGRFELVPIHDLWKHIEEAKQIGEDKKELAEWHVLRLKFWQTLLERAKNRGFLLHSRKSPTKDNWLEAGAGVKSGIAYGYSVRKNGTTCVSLNIYTEETEENKRIMESLAKALKPFLARVCQTEHE